MCDYIWKRLCFTSKRFITLLQDNAFKFTHLIFNISELLETEFTQIVFLRVFFLETSNFSYYKCERKAKQVEPRS